MLDNNFVDGVLSHGEHVACKLPTFGAAVAVAIPVHPAVNDIGGARASGYSMIKHLIIVQLRPIRRTANAGRRHKRRNGRSAGTKPKRS